MQWQCLTYGTTPSDCAAISYAGSPQIARADLAFGLCPASVAAAQRPRAENSYGLCMLQDSKGDILDTQMMFCSTCVEQCETWAECEAMVFNTHTVPRALLATYCQCEPGGAATDYGRRLLRA